MVTALELELAVVGNMIKETNTRELDLESTREKLDSELEEIRDEGWRYEAVLELERMKESLYVVVMHYDLSLLYCCFHFTSLLPLSHVSLSLSLSLSLCLSPRQWSHLNDQGKDW